MIRALPGCLKGPKCSLAPVFRRQISNANASRTKKLGEFKRLMSLAGTEKWRLSGALGLLVISSGVTMSVPFALGKVIDIIYNLDQFKDSKTSGNNFNSDSNATKRATENSNRFDFEEQKTLNENSKNWGNGTEDEIKCSRGEKEKEQIRVNLRRVCGFLVGVFAVGAAANFGRVYLMRVISQNVTAKLRANVFSSIAKQEVGFFDSRKTGELINRLSADTLVVSQAISTQISDGLRSTFMTTAGVGMMFYMSPQLALVSLGVVPPVALWGVWMGRKVRALSRSVQDSLAQANQVAEERISNIRTVRAFATEDREIERYGKEMTNVLAKAEKEALVQAQYYGMTGLSGNMIVLTVLYYGGSLVTSDIITVGNLTSFILYAAYVGIGFSGISSFYAETMKALGASSRLWEITDKVPLIPVGSGSGNDQKIKGKIEFKNVSFSYPSRRDPPILRSLDLTVEPDTVTAIVGGSGSGKSTVASLLLRLYDVDKGQIFIDGKDIKELDPSWLRRQIGTVSQEPVLFSSSILDNVTYGALNPESVTREEVEAAAKEANAHDFIVRFPDGYDTLVGERGIMLSGGQKQRIAIARAILKNPQILLLDEATSALDSASEHQVKVALDRVMKKRSVITIAHRLTTIQNADRIAVLRDGKIVEEGTYEELLKVHNGHFRNLARK